MLACLLTIQFAIDSARPKNIVSFSTSRPAPEVDRPRVRCTSKVSKSRIRLVGWRRERISHRNVEAFTEVSNSSPTAFVRKSSDPHL